MKKILSLLMLLCVAKGNPIASWEGYQQNMPNQWQLPPRYSPPLFGPFFRPPGYAPPPPGYAIPPPGHPVPPPGYAIPPPGHHYPLSEHTHSTACQQLQQLLNLPMNQQSNSIDNNCSIGWICRNSQTGDMTITIVDGEPIIISGQGNFTNPVTPQTDNTEKPHQHGGEGLIDIRMNNN